MIVPGHLFDIHPGHFPKKKSIFDNYVRFSFGPEEKNMVIGLERLTALIQDAK